MGCCRKEKKPPAQNGDKAICGTLCVCQVIPIVDNDDDGDDGDDDKTSPMFSLDSSLFGVYILILIFADTMIMIIRIMMITMIMMIIRITMIIH